MDLEHLKCRAWNHAWEHERTEVGKGGSRRELMMVLYCLRCGTERRVRIEARGERTNRYVYAEGYTVEKLSSWGGRRVFTRNVYDELVRRVSSSPAAEAREEEVVPRIRRRRAHVATSRAPRALPGAPVAGREHNYAEQAKRDLRFYEEHPDWPADEVPPSNRYAKGTLQTAAKAEYAAGGRAGRAESRASARSTRAGDRREAEMAERQRDVAKRGSGTVRFGGEDVAVGRFETRGSGAKLEVRCPKCGKWDSIKNFFLRDGGTRIYAHKPCEVARHRDQRGKPAKKSTAKRPAKKSAARRAPKKSVAKSTAKNGSSA